MKSVGSLRVAALEDCVAARSRRQANVQPEPIGGDSIVQPSCTWVPAMRDALKIVRSSLLVFAVAAGIGVLSPAARAHHSFAAEFDRKKPVTLQGVVTKLEWSNPHTRLYLDVTGPSGKLTAWELELASPNTLMRAGWTRHSVQAGDKVTVKGFLAKDGTNLANASTIITADGKSVLNEQSSADAPTPN
jgi:hypothetical protein